MAKCIQCDGFSKFDGGLFFLLQEKEPRRWAGEAHGRRII